MIAHSKFLGQGASTEMKVLVTGASGHIGGHVVDHLLNMNHSVRALVRKSSDLRGVRASEIEIVHGDIKDKSAVRKAAEGCDAVIHLAAVYKTIAKTPEEIVEPAVTGARNVLEVAVELGIKRVIYTSSVASIGFSYKPDEMRTAADWNEDAQNPYYVAKTQSERQAQKLAAESGVELIVLCPAIVLGPGDYRITPSNGLIMDLLNGRGQTYVGGMNIVDVRDVARAHVEALTKGRPDSRYIVGGENIQVSEIGHMLKKLTGNKPLHLPFGRKLTLLAAKGIEMFCRLLHLTPPFTHDLVHEVVERYAWYDTSETYATFGFQPRQAEQTLKASVAWLIAQDKVKQRVAKGFQSRNSDAAQLGLGSEKNA